MSPSALTADRAEILPRDTDITQPRRQFQVGDQLGQGQSGAIVGLAHRRRDQRLPARIAPDVPAHDRRQHDARRLAMGHANNARPTHGRSRGPMPTATPAADPHIDMNAPY